jgi:hypothetical protein
MSLSDDYASPKEQALTARDALQARADSIDPKPPGKEPPSSDSPCDGYFYAAIAHFQLAAQASDDRTFYLEFEMGQSFVVLGQACQETLKTLP